LANAGVVATARKASAEIARASRIFLLLKLIVSPVSPATGRSTALAVAVLLKGVRRRNNLRFGRIMPLSFDRITVAREAVR
jgi:hypothetical protein